MQSAWSRIWTRVAVSISYDDNHYTNWYYRHPLVSYFRFIIIIIIIIFLFKVYHLLDI